MRQLVKDFVSICVENFIFEAPIYEFGSLQVKGQEGFADLRPYFPNKEFIGTDFRQGLGVDKIMNLHKLPLKKESIGSAICVETLEHTKHPFKAMSEIYRVLKPNGICVITCPFSFPLHDYPNDYYRFTPSGFKILLSNFKSVYVEQAGRDIIPHTVVGVAYKGEIDFLANKKFLGEIEEWKEFYITMYGKNRKSDQD